MLKIASYADPCFVSDEVACVVGFVCKYPLERQYLLVVWVVYKFEVSLFF